MSEHQLVTQRMQSLIEQWQSVADRRYVFLSCYLVMTSNMKAAIEAGEFADPVWVDGLLSHFAEYYFNALQAYEVHNPATPIVWRMAHDTALQVPATATALQTLMLGINAHVTYDLVLALADILQPEWTALDESLRQQRYADHCHVNDVIGRSVDAVQDSVIDPLEPAMELVDKLMGPVDEWMTSRLISRWRDEVWQSAVDLLEVRDEALRAQIHQQVEATALKRARAILLQGGLRNLESLL